MQGKPANLTETQAMAQDPGNLVWIDLEMTGLDTGRDHILEIATVITDSQLNAIAEGPVLAVHQSDAVLDAMDDWNRAQHGGSGLIDKVRASKLNEAEAERLTLEFVQRYVPPKKSPMCGNSICQDRRFLHRWMPLLEQHFHYRNLDVSTLNELARRWKPEVADAVVKASRHQALDDVYESIRELRLYRDQLLKI
jgi:oligoribonuclease